MQSDAEMFSAGEKIGKKCGSYFVAEEMRVLFCALITAHKREDERAFYATVEIAKTTLNKYATYDDEEWSLFRGDVPMKKRQSFDS